MLYITLWPLREGRIYLIIGDFSIIYLASLVFISSFGFELLSGVNFLLQIALFSLHLLCYYFMYFLSLYIINPQDNNFIIMQLFFKSVKKWGKNVFILFIITYVITFIHLCFFILIRVTIWYYFLLAWRNSSNLSCESGLLAVNSVKHCYLAVSLYVAFIFWRIVLLDIIFLVVRFSLFKHFEYIGQLFWHSLFLMRNHLLILLLFPNTWYNFQDFLSVLRGWGGCSTIPPWCV